MKRALILIAGCLLLAGCISATVSPYPDMDFPPTDPTQVAVYRLYPQKPYIVIGEIEVVGDANTSWLNFTNEMKRKAASIGGQAVVIVSQQDQLTGIYETPTHAEFFDYPMAGGRHFAQQHISPGQTIPIRERTVFGLVIRYK